MRAAEYTRISLDKDGDGDGVERQRGDISRYCSARGWDIVHEYQDNDWSATSLKKPRPEFEQMLRDVEAGKIDVIVAKHLDRLLRRLTELERVLAICEKAGAHIVTTSDGVDTSGDGGRLVARILASVAQGEVERKGARQKAAFAQRAERGIGWGPKAFGYTSKQEGDQIIPAEAEALRDAYATILAGGSLFGISNYWNERGLLTARGNQWTGASVREVLLNPRNAGLRAYHGEIVGDAVWDAIVDRDTWEGVHAVLSDPARRIGDTRARKNMLSAIARCGKCKGYLRYGGGPKRRMYMCKNPKCYKVSRTASMIDDFISDTMVARLSRPDAVELMTPKDRADEMRDMMDQMRGLKEKQRSLATDWADGSLTDEQLRLANTRISQRLEEIDRKIYGNASSRIFEGVVGESDVKAVWEALPLERKRTIIKALCSDITINPIGRRGRGVESGDGIKIEWRTVDGT